MVFRRFGVKGPCHSENSSAKKCYCSTSIVARAGYALCLWGGVLFFPPWFSRARTVVERCTVDVSEGGGHLSSSAPQPKVFCFFREIKVLRINTR